MADAPFLDIDGFTEEYQGTLDDGEAITAERLLQVVSDRIRGLKADVDPLAAQQVVFEVVRDAAKYGDLATLSSFQNITSRRQEAGTFDQMSKVVDDYLSDKHKRTLGIAVRAAPRGRFAKCDY